MTKANLYVILQFCFILLLFMECGVLSRFPLMLIQSAAVLLGIWAITQFHLNDLAVSPVPKADARMVVSGPYKWIRNPMYLAVLLFCLPLSVDRLSLLSAILFAGLLITLLMKLNFEEQLLKKQYPEFEDYCKRSKKLIPFIY